MAYLYAGMGILMLSGIMAIFEMGVSLTTNQSMIKIPPDEYFSDPATSLDDINLLIDLAKPSFPAKVNNQGLCGALSSVSPSGWKWTLVGQGRWANSCQMYNGSHRVIVREDPANLIMPYQFYSCVPPAGIDKCSFDLE